MRAVGRIILGRSVSKIIIIALNLGFGTSKNENNDIEVKKIFAYEGDHISLLRDSTMPSALNICLSFLLQPKRKRSY